MNRRRFLAALGLAPAAAALAGKAETATPLKPEFAKGGIVNPFPIFDNGQRFDISWTADGATWTAHNCTPGPVETTDPTEPIIFERQP